MKKMEIVNKTKKLDAVKHLFNVVFNKEFRKSLKTQMQKNGINKDRKDPTDLENWFE